uniref:Nodulin-like domain-containing protein n=1 Tax=Aegilops tauschii subsp. strangulata TaxID=200361 RepID=A0A453M3Z6_AEGTS
GGGDGAVRAAGGAGALVHGVRLPAHPLSASGATYIFGLYSKVLKSALGYDQQTLNTFAFFKDLGANVGVLSGLINEVTPPWVVLAIGAAMNLVGYLMIYLAIDGRTARPPVWLMCVYICVGANSQSFTNTGALVTCVKNFPESRGAVLGLLKGFVGLSGAIFTQLYIAIYGDDAKSLVLLVAWLPAAVCIVFVHTVRIMPHRPVRRRGEEETAATTSDPFYCFLYISMALATYLLVMIVVQNQLELSHPALVVSATALMLILLLPLAVVVKQEYRIKRELEESLLVPPTVTVEKPAAQLQMAAKTETKTEDATSAPTAASPAGAGGGLHDPAGAGERGHAGAVPGDHLRRGGHADGDRQHGPDRAVPGLPAQEHQDLHLPHQHLELRRPGHRRLRVGGGAGALQVPAPAHAHPRPAAGVRRAPPHRLRRAAVALRGVGGDRVLLRGAVAAALRHHLRALRPQVLLHALQLRLRGQPHRRLRPQRARRGLPLRRGGRQAARRHARRRRRQDLRRRAVLQARLPHHHRRHRGRRARLAPARLAHPQVLPQRHLRQVQGRRRRRATEGGRVKCGQREQGVA